MGNMDKMPPVRSAERIAHHRHFSLTLEESVTEEIQANAVISTTASATNPVPVGRKEQEVQTTKETILKVDNVNHNHVPPPVPVKKTRFAMPDQPEEES